MYICIYTCMYIHKQKYICKQHIYREHPAFNPEVMGLTPTRGYYFPSQKIDTVSKTICSTIENGSCCPCIDISCVVSSLYKKYTFMIYIIYMIYIVFKSIDYTTCEWVFTRHARIPIYCQTSNISHTLVGNKLVDHSDVVGAAPVEHRLSVLLQLHIHSRLNT